MLQEIRPAVAMLVVMTALTGIAYPLAVTGVAQAVLPHQANGSVIERDGKIIGSSLIGQAFAGPGYFHGRPSAAGAGYDAARSSGSNLGSTSRALIEAVRERAAAASAEAGGARVPIDFVTASGSGLDPDISPAAAMIQVERVATARHLPPERVRVLVREHVEPPLLGLLGRTRVNVLRLNLALDRITPTAR